MTSFQKAVLVLGATGQQGGAVVKQLLANGWTVRALARDLNKPASQALRSQGIEMVQGDLNDPATIVEAMKGMYGVFSVQPVVDPEEEVRQGKTVADAAKTAGVSHFIYSSASGADRYTGIPSFEAKGKIERYIRALDLPATILRPPMFMENFRFLLHAVNGQITIPYIGSPEMKVPMIAAHDIGVFAALAFNDPDTYKGKDLEIAGDELTWMQMAAMVSRVFGRPAHYQTVPDERDQHLEGARKITAFFEREGYRADLASLRQLHPQLLKFEAWLKQTDLYM